MRHMFRPRRPDSYLTATEIKARYDALYDLTAGTERGRPNPGFPFDLPFDLEDITRSLEHLTGISRFDAGRCAGGPSAGQSAEAGLADALAAGPRGGDEPEAAVGHPDRLQAVAGSV